MVFTARHWAELTSQGYTTVSGAIDGARLVAGLHQLLCDAHGRATRGNTPIIKSVLSILFIAFPRTDHRDDLASSPMSKVALIREMARKPFSGISLRDWSTKALSRLAFASMGSAKHWARHCMTWCLTVKPERRPWATQATRQAAVKAAAGSVNG